MAIDADLSAGLIDDTEARTRRRALEEESSFFGAMDGAAKFVRGDAIAGLLITVINVVGGVIIGVGQQSLSFLDATNTYTQLSVGDGLVSQIPALIVSTAAGIVVTKAGLTGKTERALFGQLGGQPKAVAMSAVLLAALAILPGIPAFPFLLLAAVMGGIAYQRLRVMRARTANEPKPEVTQTPAEEPISSVLRIDDIRVELGYELLSLVNGHGSGVRLTDQIRAVRRQLAAEFGFVMPSVRIQDNLQLAGGTYVVYVREIEAGRGEVRPNMLLVMDPRGEPITLPGETTREPTFGLPAAWVSSVHREEALFRGCTVVDPVTVITTHLTEVIKEHMAGILSYAETRKLLDELDKVHQKLISDLIPNSISFSGVHRVLQNLLSERISIRDLPTILEGISEACGHTRNVTLITEHVRSRLARQICDQQTNGEGILPILALGPQWEQTFAESLVGSGDDRQLALPPSKLQEFLTALRSGLEKQAQAGETPVLVTSAPLRPYVRSIVERFRPLSTVIAQSEIAPKARIRMLGQI
jgi:flagellar biosynthesis protein FlhA